MKVQYEGQEIRAYGITDVMDKLLTTRDQVLALMESGELKGFADGNGFVWLDADTVDEYANAIHP